MQMAKTQASRAVVYLLGGIAPRRIAAKRAIQVNDPFSSRRKSNKRL